MVGNTISLIGHHLEACIAAAATQYYSAPYSMEENDTGFLFIN